MKAKWKIGDRVTRQILLDNGIWNRKGDSCLADSPLRHGTVVERNKERDDAVIVRFDDGAIKEYLDHGLDAEVMK